MDDDDPVFYDWIVGDTNVVRGLEIHLPPDDALLESSIPLKLISFIETDCFCRIWFQNDRRGSPQGKEAFGEISFWATSAGGLAIVVGLDSWLSPSESNSLLGRLGLSAEPPLRHSNSI